MKKVFLLIVTSIFLASCSSIRGAESNIQEKNKQIVLAFYNMAFNEHRPTQAAKLYIGDEYIQHNPHVKSGAEPFYTYFEGHFKRNPNSRVKIVRAIADEDLVALHIHSKINKDDIGSAIVDIFRLKNGKIVEHWDVIQKVEEKTASGNSMF